MSCNEHSQEEAERLIREVKKLYPDVPTHPCWGIVCDGQCLFESCPKKQAKRDR